LCTNAYQAMEAVGGELSVTLKPIVIEPAEVAMNSSVKAGKYTELVVSDTGDGVRPELIEKIFEPYFTTKEIGKGTGMGLAIIHGIMRQYGGSITVESELGKGSAFHVYFPEVAEGALPETDEVSAAPRGTERILVVDDEELLCELNKELLERLGYQVTTKLSSLEALVTFKNAPDQFDLVITDQTMPELTGAGLASHMMKIRPDIPIILCTGYSNIIDEDSARAMGIRAFATKPLTNSIIGNLVREVLDGE